MLFVLIFLTSLLVVAFAIPPIITVAFQKRLFDDPVETRKVHKRIVPNFGGIAIFSGFLFTCSLFIPSNLLPEGNILMAAGLILFLTGLKDDIVGLSPFIKFIAQFSSATILAVVANIRITNLQGIIGIYEIPYLVSIVLTVFFIVGIVNAFNLIDGIDGLAGTLAIMVSLVYGYLFFKSGELGWAYLSVSLTGAMIGFLFYNVTPAKIFMGDSGSLLLGFIAAVLSIKFLDVNSKSGASFAPFEIRSSIGLVVSILIIPIFDTLRVFTLRILRNTSPFTADSNHLHHRLLFLGLSHIQAALVLVVCNVIFIILALSLQQIGNNQLLGFLMLAVLTVNGGLSLYIERYKRALLGNSVSETPIFELYDDAEKKDSELGNHTLHKISKN
jgi:UDP-GlcNAc:undecaprenyl-phosphate GlcNAc-1-phosphate transferase